MYICVNLCMYMVKGKQYRSKCVLPPDRLLSLASVIGTGRAVKQTDAAK